MPVRRRRARTEPDGVKPHRGWSLRPRRSWGEWVLSERAKAPITAQRHRELTARELKAERLHAEDLIEEKRQAWAADRMLQSAYGEGARLTVA